MTEKDHYKYGLSGDKVDVEVAERLRAKIRTLTAELAASERYRENLAQGHVDQADRNRALEAALRLSRNYIWNNQGGWALGGGNESSDQVLNSINALVGSETETKGDANGN